MYGKIFASMFRGSLYGQWEALVTFTVMIVLADKEGEVDMTPEALSAQTSIPLEIIRKGIASLEAPDAKSRTPDDEGRRIVRVSDSRDWGWTITNYAHYRAMRTADERREYFKQHKRKQRAKKGPGVNSVNHGPPAVHKSPQSPPIAVSSKQEAEGKAKAATAPADEMFEAFWRSYPKRAGTNPKQDAREQWDARKKFGINPLAMQDGAVRYAKYCEAAGKVGTEFVMQAVRFLGQKNCFFNEPFTLPETNGGGPSTDPFGLRKWATDEAAKEAAE